MDTKRCPRCGLTKPVSDFYANKARVDGLSPYCVECGREATRVSLQALKARAVAHLGGVCAGIGGVCTSGFNDPTRADVRALQLDHVQGDGALRRKSGELGRRVYQDALVAPPGEYQVLCANCNWIKRYENREMFGYRDYERVAPTERKRYSEEEIQQRKAAANQKRSETLRGRLLDRNNEIICLFISGWRKADIAVEVGLDPSTVHATLVRYGPKCDACGSWRLKNIWVKNVDGKREGLMDEDHHVILACKDCSHEQAVLCPIHDADSPPKGAVAAVAVPSEQVIEDRRTERNRLIAAANKERQAEKNADRNTAIVELRREGKRMQEIADSLGLSVSTVSAVCAEAGVERFHVARRQTEESLQRGGETRRAKNADRNARIMELLAQGATQVAIADELGMKRSAVDQVIRRERARARR